MPGSSRLPRPRKRFGQHFLTDVRALQRIVDALAPDPGDTIVEIGPGRGALTDLLASRSRRLVAIEIDRDLVRHLRERYADQPHVEIGPLRRERERREPAGEPAADDRDVAFIDPLPRHRSALAT